MIRIIPAVPLLLSAIAVFASGTSFASVLTITANDADGDRVVDTVDVDDDNDGIPDLHEIDPSGRDIDSDNDGMPNRLDLDSDNDGIPDWQESGAVKSIDFAGIRVISARLLGDVGTNGLLDALESPMDTGQLRYSLSNSDAPADNLNDVIDLDSDNDGLPDLVETGGTADLDRNGDGRIDASASFVGNDGIADRLQSVNDKTCCDINGDGIDDIVPRNTDGTDLPDYQDRDSDNDGVSDLVESGGGDVNGDGQVDGLTDSPVVDGMDDAILLVPLTTSDINGNGVIDVLDEFAKANDPNANVTTNETDAGTTTGDTGNTTGDSGSTTGNASNDDSGLEPVVRTGINASGCSVQSSGSDWLLLLLAVLSIAVLGWRFTVRRLR